jgi:hypothetical protein
MKKQRGRLVRAIKLPVACVCLILSNAFAQQLMPPQPGLANVVYFVESSENKLKALPTENGKLVGRVRPTRLRDLIQIPGAASSFRLKAGNDLVFAFKCSEPDILQLYAFTVKGNKREAVVSGTDVTGITMPYYGLKFSLTEYGDSSYKVVVKSLRTGEYGFRLGSKTVFDFAVDAK